MLTKYYTSLLYKMTNQLPGKKTASEKFSMIVQLMTDERELTNVLDLYEIKLTNQGDIEDSIKEENSPFPIFTEVNKAYYISILDKQWAQEMHQTEQMFWQQVGLLLEHGHKLKSSFWVQPPLQSKSVNYSERELETLRTMLCGMPSLMSEKYIESAQRKVVRMMETVLASGWFFSNDKWSRVEIVRNQHCFAPHHSQGAILQLKKMHDVAF